MVAHWLYGIAHCDLVWDFQCQGRDGTRDCEVGFYAAVDDRGVYRMATNLSWDVHQSFVSSFASAFVAVLLVTCSLLRQSNLLLFVRLCLVVTLVSNVLMIVHLSSQAFYIFTCIQSRS